MEEMMYFQGGNGKSTFSQNSVYFPFGQEPTGVQELRSNLLTHVEESFWGERFPEGNCTLHEPFYKADLGLQVEQTPVERIEIEVKVNYFLKKRKGYFSH